MPSPIQSDRSSSPQDPRGMSDDLVVRGNLEGSNLVSQNARDVNRPSNPANIKGRTSPISFETVSSSYLGCSALQKAFQVRQPLSLAMQYQTELEDHTIPGGRTSVAGVNSNRLIHFRPPSEVVNFRNEKFNV